MYESICDYSNYQREWFKHKNDGKLKYVVIENLYRGKVWKIGKRIESVQQQKVRPY